ncbi:MAG: carboxy terminal-processing peptidase [Kiritimatiellae bacterium]|nr:carboxy terminal-processing peptidase [Kiritimatiellia bacterium]
MRIPLPFLLLAAAACAIPAQEPPAEPPPAIVVEDEADDPDSEYYVAPEPAAKPARRSELADPKRVRETATLVCGLLGEAHVLRKPFDAKLSPAAWTNYIDSFDPQRIYFTAEDIASFEPARTRYAELLKAGDLSFPSNVFATFVRRVADRNAFAAKAAEEEFDFGADEDYLWRRKDEPWTHEGAEQDELWRKRVKNTLLAARVSFVVDRERKAEEAARKAEKGETEEKEENKPEKKEKTEEEAVASAREDMLKSAERFLQILRDSDEEFWLPRFYDSAALAYDPHSNYMSPASSEDFDIDMNLSLQGIGATLQTDDGACKIVEIVPGSPADRDESPEHLVRGDRIVAVAQGEDGEFVDIRHWPLYKSVRLIRGPKGSTVRLRVIPVSDPDATKVVTLVRDEIKLEEQAAAGRLERHVDSTGAERPLGYVKLPGFYSSMARSGAGSDNTPRSASEDVARLLAEFNEEGAEGVVLDLRGNGGGSLVEAVRLAGLFLRTGPVVLVREGRGRPMALPDNDPAVAFRGPMVVLVDRLSASASEIVAAALQDYGRAVVAGDVRTHGKGTVQTVIALPPGDGRLGSLKPTTALFYRVSGGSTQIRGVESDIRLPSVFETYPELGEDKLPGALRWTHIAPSSFRPVDSLVAVVPELRLRSAARLATNAVWQARARLFDRFAAFNSNRVVSLRYDTRLERARADAVLQREIAALASGEDAEALEAAGPDALPDEEKEDENRRKKRRSASEPRVPGEDPVLDEALEILVDLVDLHGSPRSLSGPERSSGNDSPDSFFPFFR